MSEWKEWRIGNIAEVFDGPHATPKKTHAGPWFLSIASLQGGRLALSESAHLSDEDFVRWTRRVTPRVDDVLFSYETRLGEAALMPEGVRACLGRRMALMRPRADRVHPDYLLYAYLGPEFQQTIRQNAVHGATVDRIPLVDFPSWTIRLPDLPEQRAIAALLGALDDKIAVNERIAATSGELADALLARVLGSMQCDVAKLSDIADVNKSKVAPNDGWLKYIDISGVSRGKIGTYSRIPWSQAPGRARRRIRPGDTIWSTVRPGRRSFALVMDDDDELVASTGFAVLTPKFIGPALLYGLVTRHEFVDYLESVAEGSAYPAVKSDRFARANVPLPPQSVIDSYERDAIALRRRAHAAEVENRVLAELRDTLLPRLVSGELRVKDVEV